MEAKETPKTYMFESIEKVFKNHSNLLFKIKHIDNLWSSLTKKYNDENIVIERLKTYFLHVIKKPNFHLVSHYFMQCSCCKKNQKDKPYLYKSMRGIVTLNNAELYQNTPIKKRLHEKCNCRCKKYSSILCGTIVQYYEEKAAYMNKPCVYESDGDFSSDEDDIIENRNMCDTEESEYLLYESTFADLYNKTKNIDEPTRNMEPERKQRSVYMCTDSDGSEDDNEPDNDCLWYSNYETYSTCSDDSE